MRRTELAPRRPGLFDTRTLEGVLREALAHNTLEGLADLLRDSVTGLYIRDGFLTLGKRAMETAKRRKSTLVLLCMSEVAALLAGGFRGTDIIARLGPTTLGRVVREILDQVKKRKASG